MADLEKAKALKSQVGKLNGTLIAVSKNFSADDVKSVYGAGVRDFGENYLSEALEKIDELKELNINWHFIGRVQSGTLNKLVNRFYMIHSLYKEEHISKINDRSDQKQKVLLQLQHKSDKRGFGLSEVELNDMLKKVPEYKNIDFSGLMFMPPAELQGEDLKSALQWAYGVFQTAKNNVKETKNSWDTMSMGMSSDYELALESGSTHVRIGTAIFGKIK